MEGSCLMDEAKELLLKMKKVEFIYDTKLGKLLNKNHQQDKDYVLKILDLLYQNYDRVKYVDDLSDSVIGKGNWALLISEKFAMMNKLIPVPQLPFHVKIAGRNDAFINSKYTYYMLIGFFKDTDNEIYVSLNFRNKEHRKAFKALINV